LRVTPFVELIARPLARPRFNALLSDVFGLAAAILASIGLYPVMGTYVRQRGRDIAIRVVLGARSVDVRRLVLGEALVLTAIGAAIGLAGAVAAGRLIRGMLYEVSPLDPIAILSAALLLIGVSALAAYVPARRAVRADPISVLRLE
jgi:ABC-type antimicrobial peptide transport system permease subunit